MARGRTLLLIALAPAGFVLSWREVIVAGALALALGFAPRWLGTAALALLAARVVQNGPAVWAALVSVAAVAAAIEGARVARANGSARATDLDRGVLAGLLVALVTLSASGLLLPGAALGAGDLAPLGTAAALYVAARGSTLTTSAIRRLLAIVAATGLVLAVALTALAWREGSPGLLALNQNLRMSWVTRRAFDAALVEALEQGAPVDELELAARGLGDRPRTELARGAGALLRGDALNARDAAANLVESHHDVAELPSWSALVFAAHVATGLGEHTRASARLERALSLGAPPRTTRLALSLARASARDTAAALVALEPLGDDPEALYLRAVALHVDYRDEEALEALARARARDPSILHALLARAPDAHRDAVAHVASMRWSGEPRFRGIEVCASGSAVMEQETPGGPGRLKVRSHDGLGCSTRFPYGWDLASSASRVLLRLQLPRGPVQAYLRVRTASGARMLAFGSATGVEETTIRTQAYTTRSVGDWTELELDAARACAAVGERLTAIDEILLRGAFDLAGIELLDSLPDAGPRSPPGDPAVQAQPLP